MSEDEKVVIGCMRVSINEPHTDSIISSCNECLFPIWIAKSTPIIEGAQYLCLECINWDEVTDVATPTQAQMVDVLRARAKR
jgi:hypothetical protein